MFIVRFGLKISKSSPLSTSKASLTGRSRGFACATFASTEDALDQSTKGNQGIGFITFKSPDSVETHNLEGATIVVDRATLKDKDVRPPLPSRVTHGGNGKNNASGTRYAASGSFRMYDHPAEAVYTRGLSKVMRGALGRAQFSTASSPETWSFPMPP
ncbi:hypothetical protein AQUCO_11400003v1 [Aquilegia coerulea]|uniref:RRM domain-containing protein n=1 Tax=Aquilegia coerulea TaxID=218851 RepID=A0A2G5C2F1_AQUCA|nr:hypothetical protein AQUCO_11400003v1 [Aquilegia coerulea]